MKQHQITLNMKEVKVDILEIDREEMAVALRNWRASCGMTQEEMAKQIGVSRYVILNAEKARPVSWLNAYKIYHLLLDHAK